MSRQRPDHPPVLSVAGFKDRESPPRDLEDRWRGEHRTIQAVQRYAAEHATRGNLGLMDASGISSEHRTSQAVQRHAAEQVSRDEFSPLPNKSLRNSGKSGPGGRVMNF
jgi:hypothetical protein